MVLLFVVPVFLIVCVCFLKFKKTIRERIFWGQLRGFLAQTDPPKINIRKTKKINKKKKKKIIIIIHCRSSHDLIFRKIPFRTRLEAFIHRFGRGRTSETRYTRGFSKFSDLDLNLKHLAPVHLKTLIINRCVLYYTPKVLS